MSLPVSGNNNLLGGTGALGNLGLSSGVSGGWQYQYQPGAILPVTTVPHTTTWATYRTYTPTLADPAGMLPKGVDAEKLEKLKKAEPRKILAKVPDLTQPIIGYRCWLSDGKKLKALGAGDICWEPKKAEAAKCVTHSMSLGTYGSTHEAPSSNCNCGFWAFKEVDHLIAAASGYSNIKAIGPVHLWGRVIETENGFRAQYAYPKELWLFDNSLEELGYIYGVPVRTV